MLRSGYIIGGDWFRDPVVHCRPEGAQPSPNGIQVTVFFLIKTGNFTPPGFQYAYNGACH